MGKTDKRNLKKRSKVIQGDDEDDDNNADKSEVELTKEDEKLIAKQTGISGSVKFGAMDNFVSDGASVTCGLKRKKKKLVEKVTMDDKGYMVTEMVTEEVTD